MAFKMMTARGVPTTTRPVQGLFCNPRATIPRRSTIMRYREDEVSFKPLMFKGAVAAQCNP